MLLVDDNAMISGLLLRILVQAGYAVRAVGSGASAVDEAARMAFDVILMDVSMPGMDGIDATRAIRALQRPPGVRRPYIIGISAHALAGDSERCMAAGMDHYLTKPLRRQTLLQALDMAVRAGSGRPGAQLDISCLIDGSASTKA